MSTRPALSPMYTPPEVARRLRIDVHRVLAWIRSGRLRAMDVSAPGSKTAAVSRFTAVLGGIRGVAGGRVATATSAEAAQAPRRQGVFLTRIAPMPEIVRPPTSYCTFLLPLCRLAI